MIVQPGGGEDDESAEDKNEGKCKVKESDGSQKRDDDAKASSEAFEDVI